MQNSTLSSNQARMDTSEGVAVFDAKTRRVQITIPFAALSVNSVYRTISSPGTSKAWMTISKRGKEWRTAMMQILRPVEAYYAEPINIEISAWRGDRREWDCDNILKPLLDILQHREESVIEGTPIWHSLPIIEDDKFVQQLTVSKHPYSEKYPDGQVWIDIWPDRGA